MARWQYITFSPKFLQSIGHDFSFLDSDQFPEDVRIVRVEYPDFNPHFSLGWGKNEFPSTSGTTSIALLLVIESATYPDRTEEEIFNSPGLCLTQHVYTTVLTGGEKIQFDSYNSIDGELLRKNLEASKAGGSVLYAGLGTRRAKKESL